MRWRVLLVGIGLVSCGCAAPPQRLGEVQQTVRDRTGQEVHLLGQDIDQPAIDRQAAAIWSHPLSSDDAVRLALLNSAALQTELAQLGIARADLLQAGLVHNPVLDVIPRFPDRSPSGIDLEISVSEDLVSLLAIPARKKIAEAAYTQTVFSAADAAIDLASRTRQAYTAAQAAEAILQLRRTNLQASETATSLAQKQYDSGNISELDLSNQLAAGAAAELDLSDAQLAVQQTREDLNELLGLTDSQTHWTLAGELPPLPPSDPDNGDLIAAAMRQRLDIAAAKQTVSASAESLKLTEKLRFFASGDVGVDMEKMPDGQTVYGPTISVPLPLFDTGQADVMKQSAQLFAAAERYRMTLVKSGVEIRRAVVRMQIARQRATLLQNTMLPLQHRILELSLQHYNGMLLGVYQLLSARQNELAVRAKYIDALREYWSARAELMRATGGKI